MTVSPAELTAAGLRLDIDDAVATVTLSRPERRNAMTPAVWTGLAAIGNQLPPDVRVVVVRGAGPSFCAGIDLRMFTPEGVPGEDTPPIAADPGAFVPTKLPATAASATCGSPPKRCRQSL